MLINFRLSELNSGHLWLNSKTLILKIVVACLYLSIFCGFVLEVKFESDFLEVDNVFVHCALLVFPLSQN